MIPREISKKNKTYAIMNSGDHMKKIVIVEDDISIATELKELLDNANYQTYIVTDFKNALEEINKEEADLILLDINIPHINGEILLKELRKTSQIPVIMVTSKSSELDEVLSMSYGADDYITKPYNPTILLLRINAILKRAETTQEELTYKELKVIPQKGTIQGENVEIILTKNEMIIFMYLLKHQRTIISRDDLMTELWNNNEYLNDNALTVNISRLRTKLKESGYEESIETRKGQGYILL